MLSSALTRVNAELSINFDKHQRARWYSHYNAEVARRRSTLPQRQRALSECGLILIVSSTQTDCRRRLSVGTGFANVDTGIIGEHIIITVFLFGGSRGGKARTRGSCPLPPPRRCRWPDLDIGYAYYLDDSHCKD
jgi:hypothetical protein